MRARVRSYCAQRMCSSAQARLQIQVVGAIRGLLADDIQYSDDTMVQAMLDALRGVANITVAIVESEREGTGFYEGSPSQWRNFSPASLQWQKLGECASQLSHCNGHLLKRSAHYPGFAVGLPGPSSEIVSTWWSTLNCIAASLFDAGGRGELDVAAAARQYIK